MEEFAEGHLHGLYESYLTYEQDGEDGMLDYVQGSIDTTHVFMYKLGMIPMEYEEWLEKSQAGWKK